MKEPGEEREADEGTHNANRQLDRGEHGTRNGIGEHDQERSEDSCERKVDAVPPTEQHAGRVRCGKSNEADDSDG